MSKTLFATIAIKIFADQKKIDVDGYELGCMVQEIERELQTRLDFESRSQLFNPFTYEIKFIETATEPED